MDSGHLEEAGRLIKVKRIEEPSSRLILKVVAL